MTLAASKGTEIKVQCIGNKAEQDLEKLIDLIKNNFGEENLYQRILKKKRSLKVLVFHPGMQLVIVF